MANYSWNGSANDGNYNNPANWTPDGVPGTADTATTNTSAAATITVSQNDAVQALSVGKLDTLAVSSGETYTVGNAAASSTLSVAGTLSLNSTGYDSALIVDATTLTLNGAGKVLLGDGNDNDIIVAGSVGDVLVNVNDTIVGAGQIGLLTSTGTGQLSTNGQTTLDGSAQQVSLAGTLEVASGETITLLGTINNKGIIGLNSSGYDSDLIVASPTVTLTGSGTLALTDYTGSNGIYGAATSNVLVNVNNTIEGSGQLGAGQLTLVNDAAGVIDATGASNQLSSAPARW